MKKLLLVFLVLLTACEPLTLPEAVETAQETGECPDSVGENQLWTDAVIPVYFWYDTLNDLPFPEDKKMKFQKAADYLTETTAITVITYDTKEEALANHDNVVRLEMFPFGSGSHVGMTGEKEQEMLFSYATTVSDAIRLILLAAGLEYEHRLYGREDVYQVTIPEDWSDKRKTGLEKIEYNVYGSIPDTTSLMQVQVFDYREVEDNNRSFSVIAKPQNLLKSEWADVPLILFKDGTPVEENTELAQIDIDRLDFMYNCSVD